MKLSGKIAVITGGNSGIGFGIAQQLAAEEIVADGGVVNL